MRRKFTLIEILIVIGIIGLLAALSFGAYTFAMNKARESSTKALLKRVEAGLESCKTKYGYYPPSADYTVITVSLDGSNDITDIKFGGVLISPEMRKEFLRIVDAESFKKYIKDNAQSGVRTDKELMDSWGNSVYYKFPGKFNTSGIEIISAGADGKWGDSASSDKNDVKNTSDDLIN